MTRHGTAAEKRANESATFAEARSAPADYGLLLPSVGYLLASSRPETEESSILDRRLLLMFTALVSPLSMSASR